MRLLIHNDRPVQQRAFGSLAAAADSSSNIWRTLAHGRPPGIQVVISAWNCAPWLSRCLASVERALHGFHWVLILADDGSTDDTLAIFQAHHTSAEVKLVERFAKAANVSVAKNRAVALGKHLRASYPVMCLMDADDEMGSDRVRGLLPVALQSGAPVVAGAWVRERDGGRTDLIAPQGLMFGPWATLFHTALIPWNGKLFSEEMEAHDDLACWSEWRSRGVPLQFAPTVLTHIHVYHQGSVSNPADPAWPELHRRQLEQYRAKLCAPLLSFATSCMGRLHHLRQTLPHNLRVTTDLPDVEFCLANYNSQDGLDEWVHQNLRTHLASGRLKYQHTTRPTEFLHGHAKNIAHRLATGRWLVNLDADNFLTPEYLRALRAAIGRGAEVVHVPSIKAAWGGGYGRVVVKRDLFDHVGGYDEAHWGWGADDKDLAGRAVAAGGRLELVDPATLRYIEHDDGERTAHLRTKDKHATNAQWQTYFEGKLRNGQLIANEGREWGKP